MGITQISNMMQTAVGQNIFPGAVLLCARGRDIVLHEAYGQADLFEKIKMQKESIFDLASLTKPLATALAVARLIEDNKIDLHQEIGTLLEPFSSSQKGAITIDMLLRHTSGFPAYKKYFKKLVGMPGEPVKNLRQFLKDERLENPIGSVQEYSDLGFMVLAWIIETISNQRLDHFVDESVYKPLGIDRLFYIDLTRAKSLEKGIKQKIVSTQNCPWRGKILAGEVDDDNAWAVGGIEGHAGLFGDALSVHTLCCELLYAVQGRHPQILNADIIRQFIQKKSSFDMVAGFDTPSKDKSSSGRYFSSASIGHLGFTGTSFWIDPQTDLIVILLTNRVHPSRSNEEIKKFRPKLHDLIYLTMA